MLSIFKKEADAQGINAVMRHKDTKCVEIVHKNGTSAKPKTIGCIVFQTLDTSPYGAFIFYVALHEKFKTETLLKAFKTTKPSQQLWRQGIGRKLLHMVQFISWVQVRNISIHLCATKTSLAFYQLLKFQEYDLPFDELPNRLQSALQIENIGDVGANHDLHPMFIANHLLSSPVPSTEIIMQKYIDFLTNIETTSEMSHRKKNSFVNDEPFHDLESWVDSS